MQEIQDEPRKEPPELQIEPQVGLLIEPPKLGVWGHMQVLWGHMQVSNFDKGSIIGAADFRADGLRKHTAKRLYTKLQPIIEPFFNRALLSDGSIREPPCISFHPFLFSIRLLSSVSFHPSPFFQFFHPDSFHPFFSSDSTYPSFR